MILVRSSQPSNMRLMTSKKLFICVGIIVVISLIRNFKLGDIQNKSTATKMTTKPCDRAPRQVLEDFLLRFRQSGVRLILIETEDFLDPSNVYTRLTTDPKIVSRFGVFGEDVKGLEKTLNSTVFCNKTKIIIRKQKDLLVSIMIVIQSSSMYLGYLNTKSLPYYPWVRLHLRVYHLEGRRGHEYRWTGPEDDDDGNFKMAAEAFDNFGLVPIATSPEGSIFFRPENVEYFLWQKQASEFKACNQTNVKIPQTHPKGKPLMDQKEIEAYMNSIEAVQKLTSSLRIRSFLNCGTLLGWWRQCSIIPNDPDIDLLHWSSVDAYPELLRRLKADPKLFSLTKVKIDFGPFPEIWGKQEGFYVKVSTKYGKSVDIYFNYKKKIYDTRHKYGSIEAFDFTDNLCRADLHGYLVYVPCTNAKIDEMLRMDYGNNYFVPK